MKAATLALLLAACSGVSSRVHVTFARLDFDIPSDWTSRDSVRRGTATQMWTPTENERKESIMVIRSELAAVTAQAGSPTVDGLLADATRGLPGARAGTVVPVLTKSGLQGVSVDVSFVPPLAGGERYHRVHVVLLDRARSSLINVMYTAKDPEESHQTLDLVLSTIREEG
jgi:hypothetical protein